MVGKRFPATKKVPRQLKALLKLVAAAETHSSGGHLVTGAFARISRSGCGDCQDVPSRAANAPASVTVATSASVEASASSDG